MAEKRGNLVKLHYDFDTSKCLEVGIKNKWYRVTCKDFRSFNGPRRIVTWPEKEPVYQEYNGPVYFHDTNMKVKDFELFGLQYLNNIRPEFKPTYSESLRFVPSSRKR